MTSPYVIRLVCSRVEGGGMTAGMVYALSTFGSVLGTLGTGLWLIPRLGITNGFRLVGVALGATAAIGLLRQHRASYAGILLLPFLVAAFPGGAFSPKKTYRAPDGIWVTVLRVTDSPYAHLVVMDKGDHRLLVANGIVQTGVPHDVAQLPRASALANRYFLELLPYTVEDPVGKRVLLVGLAGGMAASILRLYDMDIECVDIDPVMVELARQCFWFDAPVAVADGRRFLEQCSKTYDFCVIDTYSGDVFPFHLATVEAVRLMKKVLVPGGTLALNFIGAPRGEPFACMWRTVAAVFGNVVALRSEESDDVQTLTLLASDRPVEFNRGWLRYLGDFRGADPISDAIGRLAVSAPRHGGFVLTDDYNPMDLLRAGEAIRWRDRTALFIGREAAFF